MIFFPKFNISISQRINNVYDIEHYPLNQTQVRPNHFDGEYY